VQWYSNSALTNLIATGNTFNPTPGVNTTVYVSQTYPGCNVASTTVNITFIDQPAAPTISPSQVNFCPGSPLPLLTATSTNSTIVWFNDQALTQSLGSGSTYQPLESQAPDIWVVSGPASCRSAATQVVLNGQQLSADWSAPASVCSGSGNVNLAALVTGDAGGTFSGTGVTGNTFNPTGLSGSIQITYSVGSGSCIVSSAQTIQVSAGGNPAWTSPGTVCSGASPINLSLLITGDAGGTFSGTGVTGTTFNPTGLSGDIVITYQVGTGLCSEELAQTITITDGGNPAWTAPTSICSGAEPIDLSALVTGDAGGTFSGSGVSGSSFDPSGLTGSIVITYVVGSGSCIAESQQTINVLPGGDPSWTSPGSLCNPTDPILLNDFITGTSGGTWSGQGVAGALFFPEGLNGPIQITYAVGSGQCAGQLAQTITIVSSINAPVVNPTVTYCQGQVATPINAGVLSGANITWYNDAALTVVLFEGNGFVPPANVSATYYVTQNVGDCASSASSVAVDFAPAPAVPTTTTDIVYCEGQSIPQLSATATGTITWYNDAGLTQVLGTGATYQPDNTVGSDVFVQTVEGNCASDAVEITLTEAAQVSADIDFEGNTATCNFQPVVLISPSSGGNLWSSGETTQSITITQAGTYTLTVTGTCNTAEGEVTFTDNGVNASFDLTEIEGLAPFTATATVTSANADNSVFFLSGASISVSDNLPFTLENEGTYTLTLISSNDEGCIDSTSRLLTVISGVLEVAIPNSFTPNGDGFNDLFKPVIKGLEEMNLIIFNRYGNQVASWKEGSVNWDGNHSGAASPDGVYFYVLMGKDYSGTEVERTGSLTIMR
jgi:gliding motility-associated-like protein